MSQPVRHPGSGVRPLRLTPFRALRYNPDRVPNLGAVTCPPYDVIGAERVADFEAAHPHNVVRLILPRAGNGEDRYVHAAHDLRRWAADRILIRDAEPALYVYELALGGDTAVGLVGGVSLHEPAERRVLPHEDVFPGPVADRTALMAATHAQLEPILLTYTGDGPASDIVDQMLTTLPLLHVETVDGATHRIWSVGAASQVAHINTDLESRQALIADGHHRYAAYLALRDAGWPSPAAPSGLAMLVDAHRHPLRLGAIHRSVTEFPWDDALEAVRRGFGSVEVRHGPAEVLRHTKAVAAGAGPAALAITDGDLIAVLADADRAFVQASMPRGRSSRWQQLAASITQEYILGTLWGVSDASPRVAYHHQAADAISRARKTAGIAVILQPPRLADVLTLADANERMPRKSTSFGPKPRTGLLMHLLS